MEPSRKAAVSSLFFLTKARTLLRAICFCMKGSWCGGGMVEKVPPKEVKGRAVVASSSRRVRCP